MLILERRKTEPDAWIDVVLSYGKKSNKCLRIHLLFIFGRYNESVKKKQEGNLMKNKLWKLSAAAALLLAMAGCSVHANTTAADAGYAKDAAAANEITQEQAAQSAIAHAGVEESELTYMQVQKDRDDGRVHYDVDFAANGTEYDYEIDAYSGEILKYEKEPFEAKDTVRESEQRTAAASAKETITEEEAKAIALADAGVSEADARLVHIERDREDGQIVYEVEFYSDHAEYSYEIAAGDGTILSKECDAKSYASKQVSAQEQITLQQAQAIALAKVSGAGERDIVIEREEEDGYLIYEGEIVYQGMEYEFEMNAAGAFIEWSEESR